MLSGAGPLLPAFCLLRTVDELILRSSRPVLPTSARILRVDLISISELLGLGELERDRALSSKGDHQDADRQFGPLLQGTASADA
jgi:hypothetical protein